MESLVQSRETETKNTQKRQLEKSIVEGVSSLERSKDIPLLGFISVSMSLHTFPRSLSPCERLQ